MSTKENSLLSSIDNNFDIGKKRFLRKLRACSNLFSLCDKEEVVMRQYLMRFGLAAVIAASPTFTLPLFAHGPELEKNDARGKDQNVQLGPRPFYLVEKMSDSTLKRKLQQC